MIRRVPRRVLPAALLVLALAGACAAPAGPPPRGEVPGLVIGMDGVPVADAEVTSGRATVRTDAQGRFTVAVGAPGDWVSVRHPGYLPRTRAGVVGDPLLVRLTPDDGGTVSLMFGGDVMSGRRFLDRDEDGDPGDGLLADPSDVAAHRALLEPLAPLLGSADLTAVNVESPLAEEPHLDPTRPRPDRAHPTKDFVFASGYGLPAALADAGVDVVGLANNHQYDLLDDGVRDTVEGFAAAGFAPGAGQFGLGDTLDAAYAAATAEVGGLRVAFLGCTSITGTEHPIPYTARPDRGGPAGCDEVRVRESVAAAKAAHDLVVFSVHGGFEYVRTPSPEVQRLSLAARQAGAGLVVNHHPHVVGGLDWDGTGLTAWTLGNLVFDQTVWPTFQSYALVVHVRGGAVVRAYLEPLVVQDYVARGVGTGLADPVARRAAGLSRGPFVVEDGALELDPAAAAPPREFADLAAGRIAELGPGWTVAQLGAAPVEQGVDLLWAGDHDAAALDATPGSLWTAAEDAGAALDPDPARGWVQRLRRDGGDARPVLTSTLHRMLLDRPGPGGRVSLTGFVRADAGARLEVRLAWYPDTEGPSAVQTVQLVDPAGGTGWRPLRIDADVPPGAVAVGVFAELAPPAPGGLFTPAPEVTAALDRVRLVEWLPPGVPATRGATHLRASADTRVLLHREGVEPGPQRAAPLTDLG